MRIGDANIHRIGDGSDAEPFVIAEIGVNHDGDVDRALRLIEAAARAGTDAVKFQAFTAGSLLSVQAQLAEYQRDAGESDPLEMLARLELTISELESCCEKAIDLGVAPIVTPFSLEGIDGVLDLPWAALKTASPDVINLPLLRRLIDDGRPLIVSTGASTLAEVERASQWLEPAMDRVCFLQCVSSYPVPEGFDALDGMHAIAAAIRTLRYIGYSDHTTSTETGVRAVQRGATILEKHFTDDRGRPGPDHAASLDEQAFAMYTRLAKSSHVGDVTARDGDKWVLDCELDVRRVSRQSLAFTRDLSEGAILRDDDIATRRPGTGFEPARLDEFIGGTLARSVHGGSLIEPGDVLKARDSAA